MNDVYCIRARRYLSHFLTAYSRRAPFRCLEGVSQQRYSLNLSLHQTDLAANYRSGVQKAFGWTTCALVTWRRIWSSIFSKRKENISKKAGSKMYLWADLRIQVNCRGRSCGWRATQAPISMEVILYVFRVFCTAFFVCWIYLFSTTDVSRLWTVGIVVGDHDANKTKCSALVLDIRLLPEDASLYEPMGFLLNSNFTSYRFTFHFVSPQTGSSQECHQFDPPRLVSCFAPWHGSCFRNVSSHDLSFRLYAKAAVNHDEVIIRSSHGRHLLGCA